MRAALSFRLLLLAASICAPLAAAHAQAPTVETAVPAATQPGPVAEFKPTTLLKLGTGLTRQVVSGAATGVIVPVVLGAERQLAPAWSVYGNLTGVSRFGKRQYFQEGTAMAILSGLGFDLGVRRYYGLAKRQAERRATGPLVGNYFALEGNTDSFRAGSRLYHDNTGLAVLWGMQRRIGGYGLVDAYTGLGLKSFYGGTLFNRIHPEPTLELGLKFSLVR